MDVMAKVYEKWRGQRRTLTHTHTCLSCKKRAGTLFQRLELAETFSDPTGHRETVARADNRRFQT